MPGDNEEQVLVADFGNDRLQFLDKSGKWSVVNMNPRVRLPVGALYVKGQLYVISAMDKVLYKYDTRKGKR